MSKISANLDGHPIEVMEAGGKSVCVVSPLFLTAPAADLATAYEAIRSKRNRLIQEAVEAGVDDRLFSYGEQSLRPASASNGALSQFAIRAAAPAEPAPGKN